MGTRTHRALSERLKIRAQGQSLLLQRMVVDFAAEQSFESASERLCLHHAVSLSASCIRKITYHHAQQIKQQQQTQGQSQAEPVSKNDRHVVQKKSQ